MPTRWWFWPVMRLARVGEHNDVTWKRLYRSPLAATRVDVRRGDVGSEAAELGEAGVVEDDDDDVGRARGRTRQDRERRRRLNRVPADAAAS